MSEERWRRAKAIVKSALSRAPEDRSRFLREACGDDPSLLSEVESLLRSCERIRSRLESEADSLLGRRIGKYEVLERVGQGAMGVVYKARDPLMRRLVGIKTMSSEIATDPELHDRFYREARSAGNLSHKNVITIYDLGEDGGRPYIAMEFLTGEDLKSKLDRRSRLSLEERIRWMREILEGLEHAHGKQVIHRDVKPANVFINREGEVKILDFGLARLASSVATKSGLVMGTPSYMSPEQVRGEKLDERSDLFSAGATFYELLSYRKPFAGESIHGVFFKILETAPEPLGALEPRLPLELAEIVEKCMAKDRDARYRSAEEGLRDLRRFEGAFAERKRSLRLQVMEALGKVESISARYRELSEEGFARPGDPSEAPTLQEILPDDYFGLAAALESARKESRRLEAEIEKLRAASRLLEEASSLEARGELAAAVGKADGALRLAPRHASAASFADRVSRLLASRDPRWRKGRIQGTLREAERGLEKRSFDTAGERARRALALDPGNEEALRLQASVVRELEKERREREAQGRALRLVQSARVRLANQDDPAGCLALLEEALELVPDHSGALDLKEKAESRLALQKSLATEETAAEAIAAATLAMRRGELDLAEQEVARATRADPESTEIGALTLLLERAKQGREESGTRREKEVEARRPAPRPVRRAFPGLRVLGLGAALAAVGAGYVGWRVLMMGERETPLPAPDPTTVPVTTSALELATTSAAPTTTLAPTTSAGIEPTSTVLPRSSSSTVPASTTSSVPTSTVSTSVTTTAPPISTTSAPAPPPLRAEDPILELMARYEAAYESLDVPALGAIYPSVPLSVKNSFQHFKELRLEMEPLAGPEVSRTTAGPTATAVYRILQTVEPKVGKTTVSRHKATFLFAGVGSAWIIVRVDFEPDG